MNQTALYSTFILTVLSVIGLFFFIRASVKKRIQQVKLVSDLPESSLFSLLKTYFSDRSYQVIKVDRDNNEVLFEGFVSPSLFLAILLSILSICGIFSLILVLSQLFHQFEKFFFILLIFSPFAGLFYWQNAGRKEQVSIKVTTLTDAQNQTLLIITGHRDELANLKETLNLTSFS